MNTQAPRPAKEYMPVVGSLLAGIGARQVLDAPCGSGWLAGVVDGAMTLDGIDLYTQAPPGYRRVQAHDLNLGLPDVARTGEYDAVVSCEGLEHVSNPLKLLQDARQALRPGGLLIITTPNTWHPAARVQYLARGFFPGFPSLAGRILPGSHMHVMPWNFASLYLHLRLAGFESINIHEVQGPQPKHALEWLIGWPSWLYCRRRQRHSTGEEERLFWRAAGSRASLFARRLVVSGQKSATGQAPWQHAPPADGKLA
jgi:SAM-dependent methyltransferase